MDDLREVLDHVFVSPNEQLSYDDFCKEIIKAGNGKITMGKDENGKDVFIGIRLKDQQ